MLGSPTWSCAGRRGWAVMLTLSYLITRSAGSIRWASRWHRQVTGWGQGQTPRWVGGRASVPLRSRSWDYRARRLVLTAPGPKGGLPGPGEGESLQALSPVALSSLGTGRDRPARTPRGLSASLLQLRKSRPRERSVLGSQGRAGNLGLAAPSPAAWPQGWPRCSCLEVPRPVSPPGSGLSWSGRQACGASTVVLLVAQGSWETWPWLRNVRGLPQTDEGAAEVENSRARWGPARCPGPGS